MKTKNPEQKEFYAYVLCDARIPGSFKYGNNVFSFEPFYVGKGRGDRANFHVREANGTKINSHKLNKIRKIIREGHDVVIRKTRLITEAEAFDKERELIKTIGRLGDGGPLVNLTDGGDGVSGLVFTTSSRKKQSNSQRLRFASETEEQALLRRDRMLEIVHQPEVRARRGTAISEAHAARSGKEKQRTADKLSQAWKRMSPEIKEGREQKRLATLAAKSDQEKAAIAERKRATRKAKGENWERLVQSKRLNSLNARDPSEIRLTREKLGTASRDWHEQRRHATLSDKAFLQIRKMYATGKYRQVQLAEKFGITQMRVHKIVTDQETRDYLAL